MIAKAYKEKAVIEQYGSDISRIWKIWREYGIKKPRLEEILNGFTVTLIKGKVAVNNNGVEGTADNVADDRLGSIMKLIAWNNQISAARIAKILKVTNRTVQLNIEKLKVNHKL